LGYEGKGRDKNGHADGISGLNGKGTDRGGKREKEGKLGNDRGGKVRVVPHSLKPGSYEGIYSLVVC